jgi:hypothetical protein
MSSIVEIAGEYIENPIPWYTASLERSTRPEYRIGKGHKRASRML